MVDRLTEAYRLDIPEEKLVAKPIPTLRTRFLRAIRYYPILFRFRPWPPTDFDLETKQENP